MELKFYINIAINITMIILLYRARKWVNEFDEFVNRGRRNE